MLLASGPLLLQTSPICVCGCSCPRLCRRERKCDCDSGFVRPCQSVSLLLYYTGKFNQKGVRGIQLKSEHITFRDYKHGGFLLCDIWDYQNAYRSESRGDGGKEAGHTSINRCVRHPESERETERGKIKCPKETLYATVHDAFFKKQ